MNPAYGGSDRTDPSFLRSNYVRYENINTPLKLGRLERGNFIIRGEVGAERGVGTLYFEVDVAQACKIGCQLLPGNPRLDQYVYTSIVDSNGDPIPAGSDGYAYSGDLSMSARQAERDLLSRQTETEIGYVERGYWNPVYETPEGVVITLDAEQARTSTQQEQALIENFAYGSPIAPNAPAGVYYFTVSCTRWQATPYAVQIVIDGRVDLKGEAGLRLTPRARLSRTALVGRVDVGLTPRGALRQDLELVGRLDATLRPRAVISRETPSDF